MSPSIRTMGFFMSEINFCNTKEQLNHLGEVVTGKVDGSPTGADIDTSTLTYTGQVRKTLPALEAEAEESIASYKLKNLGAYASGILIPDSFSFIQFDGKDWFAINTPYTTTAITPDNDSNMKIGAFATMTYVKETQSETVSYVDSKNSAQDNRISTNESNINALQSGQQSGVIVFQTYSSLTSYTPQPDEERGSFKVASDPDNTLNGFYSWVSGTTYTKDASLVDNTIDKNNTSNAVSGSAVYDFNAETEIRTSPVDYPWAVTDAYGKAAIGVNHEGATVAASMDIKEAQGRLLDVYNKADTTDFTTPDGYSWVIKTDYGVIPVGLRDDGTLEVAELLLDNVVAETMNGVEVSEIISGALSQEGVVRIPNLDADVAVALSYGQSLSVGTDAIPPISTTQRYNNLMLDTGIIYTTGDSPSSLLPAIEQQEGTLGETPISGAGDMIQQLIATENGIVYTDHNYQIGGSATGSGGTAIAGLVKGTSSYAKCTSAIQQFKDLANANGKLAKCLGWFWTQGESDYINNTTAEEYKTAFQSLLSDLSDDAKVITGQIEDYQCISYQVQAHSVYGHSGDPYLAIAQWEMSNSLENYHMACPLYWSTNAVHQTNIESKVLGAYYGLCYKRVVVDGAQWKPLQPNNLSVQGNVSLITFDVPRGEIVRDVALNPIVANDGITYVDALDQPYNITSVKIVNKNTVRVTTDSAVTAGSKLRYGFGGGVAGGNFRDTQGDVIKFDPEGINHPMHNWCVIFELTV